VNLQEIQPRVRLILKKLKPLPDDHDRNRRYTKFKPFAEFPVPELVLLVLRDVLGLKADGPWEKTRWGVSFEYEGAYVCPAKA
jgi:hypothetical protein